MFSKLLPALTVVISLFFGAQFIQLNSEVMIALTQEDQIQQEMLDPYVQINVTKKDGTKNSLGSGVCLLIRGHIYVLSAGHLDQDNPGDDQDRNPELQFTLVRTRHDFKLSIKAEVVKFSAMEVKGGELTHDLLLLKPATEQGLVAAHFSRYVPVREGMEAWYVGTPCGLHRYLEKTIIGVDDYEQAPGAPMYVVGGLGTFGNSGGPLYVKYNGHYYLVGIVTRIFMWPTKGPLKAQTLQTISDFLDL